MSTIERNAPAPLERPGAGRLTGVDVKQSRAASRHPHGTWRRYNAGCRCDECRAANRERVAEARKRRRNASPEEIPHGLGGYENWGCRCDVCCAANTERFNRRNAESLPGAKKHYQEWTGPELEVAARKDLTAKQVAEMLGRTISSVNNARRRLNTEPKLQNLAGLRSDPST